MRIRSLVTVLKRLKGVIPEPIRALFIAECAKQIGLDMLSEKAFTELKEWTEHSMKNFVVMCNADSSVLVAPINIDIEQSELSKFIQHWFAMNAYMDGETKRGFTPEMRKLVREMLFDLRRRCGPEEIDIDPVDTTFDATGMETLSESSQ